MNLSPTDSKLSRFAMLCCLALLSTGCQPASDSGAPAPPVQEVQAPSVQANAQGFADSTLAHQLLGSWEGSGQFDGNRLSLTRAWTLELGGQFLKADMLVTMPNGATFGALMYWKVVGEGEFEVIWMDGIGRIQKLRAVRDVTSGKVFSDFVDPLTETGSESRRWEFESHGADSYVERLYRFSGPSPELLAEWVFRRR